MGTYRISKYNPQYREGANYTKEEWTDYSDIGRTIAGQAVTRKEYEEVEGRYISCLTELISLITKQEMQIVRYEIYDNYINWMEGQYVRDRDIALIIRDCLRNKCWCELKGEGIGIDFGYDYYVHIDTCLRYDEIKPVCDKWELFLERW